MKPDCLRAKKVYVCCFIHHDETPSVPMAIFTNEKAAREYTEDKNKEHELKYYYYQMEANVTYWWKKEEHLTTTLK